MLLEQDIGFEPMTFSLATKHSTTELILHTTTYYTIKLPACQIMLHACKTYTDLQRRMLQMRLA